jgi:hypothetical protein
MPPSCRVVAEGGDQVEVVQDGEGSDAGGADEVEDLEAGPDFEVVGEFVQGQ